jgi:hypothetical protein
MTAENESPVYLSPDFRDSVGKVSAKISWSQSGERIHQRKRYYSDLIQDSVSIFLKKGSLIEITYTSMDSSD